jgi:hypothetical protein
MVDTDYNGGAVATSVPIRDGRPAQLSVG